MEQEEHAKGGPERHATTPNDEDVGQENNHPEQIAEIQNLINEEALNRRIFADGCQQIGFDEHGRCLLGHEAHTEVDNQQERHDVEQHLRNIFLGSEPSQEGAQCNKLNRYDCNKDVSYQLSILVGLKHGVTLFAELGVLA